MAVTEKSIDFLHLPSVQYYNNVVMLTARGVEGKHQRPYITQDF